MEKSKYMLLLVLYLIFVRAEGARPNYLLSEVCRTVKERPQKLRCAFAGEGHYISDVVDSNIQHVEFDRFQNSVLWVETLPNLTRLKFGYSMYDSLSRCGHVRGHHRNVGVRDGGGFSLCPSSVQTSPTTVTTPTIKMPSTTTSTKAYPTTTKSISNGKKINNEALNRLVQDLLVEYNSIVPPAYKGINVDHSLYMSRVVGLNHNILTTDSFVMMRWTEGRLAWDPASYDGIDSVRVPANNVWLPDITLYNDASYPTTSLDSSINVVIDNDGHVTYVPRSRFHSHCNHGFVTTGSIVTCDLVFGSWTYGAEKLSLSSPTDGLDLTEYTDAGSVLKLVDSSASTEEKEFKCCAENYALLKYSLTLQFK